jgi:hypothetical protein
MAVSTDQSMVTANKKLTIFATKHFTLLLESLGTLRSSSKREVHLGKANQQHKFAHDHVMDSKPFQSSAVCKLLLWACCILHCALLNRPKTGCSVKSQYARPTCFIYPHEWCESIRSYQ